MGDYNVQIISAIVKSIKGADLEAFRTEVLERLPLRDSAYHATAPFLSIINSPETTISMITQAKWNRGTEDFLDWLEPMVTQGMGMGEVWAINYSEYSAEPTVRKKIYRDEGDR